MAATNAAGEPVRKRHRRFTAALRTRRTPSLDDHPSRRTFPRSLIANHLPSHRSNMTTPTRRMSLVRSLATLTALLLATACEPAFTVADVAAPPLTPSAPRYTVSVPAQGTASTLDVGTWNIEWFGDPSFGPTNEALQQSNVRDVIAGADEDIWGLEEVVTKAAFDTLIARLPGYAGLLANDPSVVNGPQYYSEFSNMEQKVALVYKTSRVLAPLPAVTVRTAPHLQHDADEVLGCAVGVPRELHFPRPP